MPQELQQKLQAIWQQIHTQLGTEFNFDFWTKNQPRRSTYPACRAVIAASMQGREEDMILAIQRAYYLRALNPSDTATHQQLAEELSLDVGQFMRDLESSSTERTLQQQINLSRQWPIAGFPSLVLQMNEAVVPISLDYRDCQSSLQDITAKLAGQIMGQS
ncbi:DsbA family protein [Maricurvus nonylphenolicus]